MTEAKAYKPRYEIDFDIAPERGSIIAFDGHPFEVMGYEAYARRDGSGSSLIIWNTTCVDCGVPMEVKTSFKSKTITKRCEAHKKRGVPATKAAAERLIANRARQPAKAKR